MGSIDKELYGEEYYKSNNYSNYLERYERYKKLAEETTHLMSSLGLVDKLTYILDYGCAIGQLVCALRNLSFSNSFGLDISHWAIQYGRDNLTPYIFHSKKMNEDYFANAHIMYSLDVFEHMNDNDVVEALTRINPRVLIIRIPVAKEKGGDFHLQVSRNDPTHINCKTKNEWKDLLSRCGFTTILHLNLMTIYDSPGVFCAICLKNEDTWKTNIVK